MKIATPLITLVSLLAILACVSAASASAETTGPVWKIMSVSEPTNLAPDSPRNEVREITVDATGGTFTLQGRFSSGCEASTTQPLPYDAPAADVQSALESFCEAANSVTVSQKSAGEPYVVTFVGHFGDQPIALLTADGSSLMLPGGTGIATVATVVRGALPPQLTVTATNVGGEATSGGAGGSPIVISDSLPSGLSASGISGFDAYASGVTPIINRAGSAAMSCSAPPTLECTYAGGVDPGDSLIVTITLEVPGLLPSTLNQAMVSGGGAVEASLSTPIAIGGTPAGFGPVPQSVMAATSTDQAGAHASFTTSFAMNTDEVDGVAGDVKDIRVDTPTGLVGNTVGMPRCTMAKVLEQITNPTACPTDTLVGMATLILNTDGPGNGDQTIASPIYNIAPAPGEPAAFAFEAAALPVRLDTSVLSDGNFAVRVTIPSLAEAAETLWASTTIWGVPADHSGPGANGEMTEYGQIFGGPDPGQTRVPLLTNPQQCSEPLSTVLSTDSWTNQGVFVVQEAPLVRFTGCDRLSLESSFTMLPDTLEAGAPAGYSFALNVPQHNEPNGLATPDVKQVKLTLPLGTVINPSAAVGLKACSNAQFYGAGRGPGNLVQEPAQPRSCPREAQVGKVRIKTPALEEALEGEVYLAEPECTGWAGTCSPEDAQNGKMIRLFLQVLSEGEGGIVVKLEGHGRIDQQTGQITTTFENNPQLPFSNLKLELGGGSRATLANPRACGPVTSNLDLTPWSTPFSADSTPLYGFEVDQGCFGPQFNPSFVAGLTNLQAGEYGPFTLSFGRADQDQSLGGLELKTPPGLLGSLAHVPLCPEPQAAQGTCGQQSLIGHTQVLTGPGADPFLVTGGQVFLTEGYKGAPFGLSIVVPAVAGPYTLSGTTGHGTVVVRATIGIDPYTAALTVKSDPLPTMLDGIPLQLKVVNVTIDRPQFTFAPTNCAKQQVTGTLSSTEGLSAPVASPFQVTNCPSLAFTPGFTASTARKTSRSSGASLTVKLTYPNTPQGSEANIAKVKVDLPKQLPSRLTTLQKACTAATFGANPANCPPASVVGHAKAITPILPVPLEGPAYFVSHGGEAFPSLIVVLQGYGVTIDLVGTTFISNAGITSSTFKTVPDVPVGSFELTLPEGKYSALAANGNLCTSKLVMPTAFVGQNGAVIHESTPISVTGCVKTKALTRAQKLTRALKVCKRDKGKSKRAKCQKVARKKYGTAKPKSAKR